MYNDVHWSGLSDNGFIASLEWQGPKHRRWTWTFRSASDSVQLVKNQDFEGIVKPSSLDMQWSWTESTNGIFSFNGLGLGAGESLHDIRSCWRLDAGHFPVPGFAKY